MPAEDRGGEQAIRVFELDEEEPQIAPRRQASSMLALEGSRSVASFLLATTAGQESVRPRPPPPRTAPATGTSTFQIQKQQILLPLLQTTMASKERNRRPLHRIRSTLPLATTAGEEGFTDADRSRTSRARSHQVIGEGGVADAPASLQPQEQKNEQQQP